MEVDVTKIGRIALGVDGSDEYVQLIFLGRRETPPSKDFARDWLLDRVYKDTTQEAGGYFCHNATILSYPHKANAFVGIIHHRYDV
jgi:hypothetical protein